jgi:group I intron endonuclease
MKKIGIYKITSPSNKIYIGQSVDIENRFKAYLRYSCKSQPKLLASLKKYGSENHKFEILLICVKEELSVQEKFFVDIYKSFNSEHGLNIRDGGGNSAKLSNEQKLKISNSLKGKKHSTERIEANRKGQIGKSISENHKVNISKGVKGKLLGIKLSEEHKMKLSISHIGNVSGMKGKNHSEKTKKAIREKTSGQNNPNFGKQRSQKTKDKISQTLKNKKILCQKL